MRTKILYSASDEAKGRITMEYLIGAQTDIGSTRPSNEDSVCIKRGHFGDTPVVLVAVCDGMGGLDKGGLASATVVKTLSRWYEEKLPEFLPGPDWDRIKRSLEELAEKLNRQIGSFGESTRTRLGTTLCAMLIIGSEYELINIGDSRAYIISNGARQLTKDQTFIQRELDRGTITLEQARTHPKRNMLLQCIGASKQTIPEMSFGSISRGETYLLCTDGFRHHITNDELFAAFGRAEVLTTEDSIRDDINSVITLVMQRGEKDNITAAVIRAV